MRVPSPRHPGCLAFRNQHLEIAGPVQRLKTPTIESERDIQDRQLARRTCVYSWAAVIRMSGMECYTWLLPIHKSNPITLSATLGMRGFYDAILQFLWKYRST